MDSSLGGKMPRKTLYILSAVAILGFALGLLLMSDTFWGLYGVDMSVEGAWVGRMMTSVMLANVYIFWAMRNAPYSSPEAKIFSQGQVIAWGLTALISVLMYFYAGVNSMIFGNTVLGIFFAVFLAIDASKT